MKDEKSKCKHTNSEEFVTLLHKAAATVDNLLGSAKAPSHFRDSGCIVTAALAADRDVVGRRCVLQRRLRILTARLEVAKLPAEVYAGADVDAILLLLFHKISIAAAAQGASEGRALLQDWLVLFTASYNRHQNATLTSADQVSCQSLHGTTALLYVLPSRQVRVHITHGTLVMRNALDDLHSCVIPF